MKKTEKWFSVAILPLYFVLLMWMSFQNITKAEFNEFRKCWEKKHFRTKIDWKTLHIVSFLLYLLCIWMLSSSSLRLNLFFVGVFCSVFFVRFYFEAVWLRPHAYRPNVHTKIHHMTTWYNVAETTSLCQTFKSRDIYWFCQKLFHCQPKCDAFNFDDLLHRNDDNKINMKVRDNKTIFSLQPKALHCNVSRRSRDYNRLHIRFSLFFGGSENLLAPNICTM